MLSNLNIESYITERLNTGRKYNLVKLNNKWYILDIDNNYILVGFNTADFKPDSYSNNIYVSAYNYNLKQYDINYNEIYDLTGDKKEIVEPTKEVETTTQVVKEKKKIELDQKELSEWILLIISMCVIILVIRHYTR